AAAITAKVAGCLITVLLLLRRQHAPRTRVPECRASYRQRSRVALWAQSECNSAHRRGNEMTSVSAAKSGTFKIGGDLAVHRLGFGAMRIVGKGVWGEPEDRDEALRTLRRVPELGINLIDTADSYGPEISERLIREALYPYKGLVIATKGGLLR